MKALLAAVALFCLMMLQIATLAAQGVYMTRGESGPVFTDKPQPGAKEVALPPLNVVAPPPLVKGATPAAGGTHGDSVRREAAALSYNRFSVVSPENEGSVVANTAIFEVRVAVDPPLLLGERHAIAISINGRPVGQRFTASEFMVPPEFWGDTLPPANQRMQLDATIVDGNGQVLIKAAPVRFYMRYATIMNHPKRAVPLPAPLLNAPSGNPQPGKESAIGATIRRPDK